jgi:hypothetical protein
LGVLDSRPYVYPPLLNAEFVFGFPADGCEVVAFPIRARDGATAANVSWNPCTDAGVAAPLAMAPSLIGDGALLVGGGDGVVWGVRAPPRAGAPWAAPLAWAVRFPRHGLAAAPPPLLLNNSFAALLSSGGSLTLLPLRAADAPPPPAAAAAGCAPGDAFLAPLTALPAGGGPGALPGVLALSTGGCAVAFSVDLGAAPPAAALLWASPPPPGGGGPVGTAVAPPGSGAIYHALLGGLVCCRLLNGTGGAPCGGWPGACVNLTAAAGAAPPLATGLAVSPPTLDYHGGQLYVVDAAGALFVVNMRTGVVGASGAASPPWAAGAPAPGGGAPLAPPVLVSDAAGKARDLLLLALPAGAGGAGGGPCGPGGGTAACVVALRVGDNTAARDDDDTADDADDDGGATTGPMWTALLVGGGGSGGGTPASAFPPPAAAVTPEGHVLLSSPGGLFVVYAAAAPPDPAPSEAWLYSIALSAVALGVLGMAVAIACVVRQRRLRSLQLLREIEEAEGLQALEEALLAQGKGDAPALQRPKTPVSADVLVDDAGAQNAQGGTGGSLLQDGGGVAAVRRTYVLKKL